MTPTLSHYHVQKGSLQEDSLGDQKIPRRLEDWLGPIGSQSTRSANVLRATHKAHESSDC